MDFTAGTIFLNFGKVAATQRGTTPEEHGRRYQGYSHLIALRADSASEKLPQDKRSFTNRSVISFSAAAFSKPACTAASTCAGATAIFAGLRPGAGKRGSPAAVHSSLFFTLQGLSPGRCFFLPPSVLTTSAAISRSFTTSNGFVW